MQPRFACLLLPLLACGTEVPLGTSSAPIVNGSRDPASVSISIEQQRSIGWLYPAGDPESIFCTGTLIAPRVVATAEHCVTGASPSEIGFGVGLLPSSPEGLFELSAIYSHPSEDAAVLVLSQDATLAPWSLVPIPANTSPILPASIGKAMEAAGYGETFDASRDGRWFATVYLAGIGTDQVLVDGRGIEGICQGDSGGPLLDTNASGQVVVLAVESWGDSSCVGEDYMVRLDAIADWMAPVLAGDSPLDPCEGLDELGRCTGALLEWCQEGEVRALDCASLGTSCGLISEASGYDCTCGDLDYLGRCDRGVAEYCDEGAYRRVNCERRGDTCAFVDTQIGYFCTDTPACRADDELGRCAAGDVAMACERGINTRRLCAAEGLVCEVSGNGVVCVTPGVGAPDAGSADAGMSALDLGMPEDGGVVPLAPDAGTGDTSASTDAGGTEDEGGCGCNAQRSKRSVQPAIWLGLLAGAVLVRRRRPQSGSKRTRHPFWLFCSTAQHRVFPGTLHGG